MAIPHSSLPEALADTEESQAMTSVLLEYILAQRNAGGHSVNTESSVSWWFISQNYQLLAGSHPHTHTPT